MTKKFERLPIPPLNGYWNAPSPTKYGDKTCEVIFTSVGRALTEWESIETAFSLMFGLFVESGSEAAKRAYGAITSPNGRSQALLMAAEIFAGRKKSKFPWEDFELLRKHHQNASGRRNEIAHGIVTTFNLDGTEHGCFLMPASYNSKKTDARTVEWWEKVASSEDQFEQFGAGYRYTSTDINHFGHLFHQLAAQVNSFLIEQIMLYNQKKFDEAPEANKQTIQFVSVPSPQAK